MHNLQKAILARKLGMTQIFDEIGRLIPVTVIEAGPNYVVQKKTVENDGYSAVQVGFVDIKERKANKPKKGHFAKSGVSPKKYLRELKLENAAAMNVGDEIKADIFAEGEKIDVTGITKGKGFAGVMKRHGFHGLRASHGVHRKHRSPGSIGACATPGHVFKGTRMAGRMGHQRQTVQNLLVHAVDAERGLLLVRGAIPGPNGALVVVRNAVKKGDLA